MRTKRQGVRIRTSTSSSRPTSTTRCRSTATSFDLVYANFVVEHLASPDRAFAEWRRVLRPGGTPRPADEQPREPADGGRGPAAGAPAAVDQATRSGSSRARRLPDAVPREHSEAAGTGHGCGRLRGRLGRTRRHAAPLRSARAGCRAASARPSSDSCRPSVARRSSPPTASDRRCSEPVRACKSRL